MVAAGTVLSALMVVTWFQVQRWRDSATIFTHALKVTQRNYLAHNNLGTALLQDGRIADAMFHFEEAVRIKPDYADAYTNMGVAMMAFQGKPEEAIPYYFRALQVKQNDERLHNNLANSLSDLGRLDEAIHHFREALRIRPDHAEAHNNIGVALARQNRLGEAIPHFRKALRIKPDYADAENNMGSALARRGKLSEAVWYFERALQLDSGSAMAHNNLGVALMRMGRPKEAVGHFTTALSIKPDYAEARNNLHTVQKMIRVEKRDEDQ